MNTFFKIALGVLGLGNSLVFGKAPPPRVSADEMRSGEIRTLALVPGLVSILEFQTELKEARLGDSRSFSMKVDPPQILLQARSGEAKPTNLLVRTAQGMVIFDLHPQRGKHQDFVQVKVNPKRGSKEKLLKQGESF